MPRSGRYEKPKPKRKFRKTVLVLFVIILLLAGAGAVTLYARAQYANAVDTTPPAPPSASADAPTEEPTVPTMQETTIPDDEPPAIEGVRDQTLYQNDAISYRMGVTVTDNIDPNPTLDVDNSMVDLSTPGVYTAIYTATDAAGNSASVAAIITVEEKPEGYAEPEVIDAAVKELVSKIIKEDMSTTEQVQAIYDWTRDHLSYHGSNPRYDWRQGGYDMLNRRSGDCYGFFAVAKLCYEELGIPNIDVVKVPNSEKDSNHFWSLVSVDGGETYYHVDCTPRRGQISSLCLVTDEFLDKFSARNFKCFNRDTSLYPATPEE